MANIAITTGEQTITATGAVTGTIDTSTLLGDFTIHARSRGLTAGKIMMVQLEDTANASAFTDAIAQKVYTFVGGGDQDGDHQIALRNKDLRGVRAGVTNSKLRFNVTVLSSTPGAVSFFGWAEV